MVAMSLSRTSFKSGNRTSGPLRIGEKLSEPKTKKIHLGMETKIDKQTLNYN